MANIAHPLRLHDEVRDLWLSGQTVRAIAASVDLPKSTVSDWILEYNRAGWKPWGAPQAGPRPRRLSGLAAQRARELRAGLTSPCWLWPGKVDLRGYAKIGSKPAHRAVYEALVGPIPPGLQIDHLCHVRHCMNPTHLEAVTPEENQARSLGQQPPILS